MIGLRVLKEKASFYHYAMLYFGDILAEKKEEGAFRDIVQHTPGLRRYPWDRFKGIVQKMAGEDHNVMRITAALGHKDDIKAMEQVFSYVLTRNADSDYYRQTEDALAKVRARRAEKWIPTRTVDGFFRDLGLH